MRTTKLPYISCAAPDAEWKFIICDFWGNNETKVLIDVYKKVGQKKS